MEASSSDKIVAWGEGKEERDLLYVSDMVNFVQIAIEKQKEPYFLCNVGRGESVSIKNMIQKIIDVSGKDISLEFDKTKPSIDIKIALDTTLVKQHLGWEPAVSFEEGIKKTLAWYKSNIA